MNEVVYQPGDKIYNLFKHSQVLVEGKDDTFIIKITKIIKKEIKEKV